nr:Rab family GTPase [Candidatus Sigynarchaeum springense]
MTETITPANLVKAVIYAVFDEKAGPVARCFLPGSFPEERINEITFKSMSFTSMSERTAKSVAVIPYPLYNLKGLVKNVVFDHPRRRGGKGECCLVLVFDETRDCIFYKYIKQFEKVINTYSNRFTEAEQLEDNLVKGRCNTLLNGFLGEITALIADLAKAELMDFKDAFPVVPGVGNQANKIRYKLIVVGDPEVGKTSLVLSFTERAFRRTYIPTIGVNISEKAIMVRDKRVEFVLWDIAGQSKFLKMRTHFYEGAQALLLVFDLTRPETFKSVSDWHADIVKSQKAPIIACLAGNKADLVSQRKVGREAAELAQHIGMQYLETSALTGANVIDSFRYIAEKLLEMNKLI